MSYQLCILKQPVPEDDGEAWDHLGRVLERRDSEHDLPPDPWFLKLIEKLDDRYPCLQSLPDHEQESSPWLDAPLRDNAEHSMTMLALSRDRVESALSFIVRSAHALRLVVFDEQEGQVLRPPALPRGPYGLVSRSSCTYDIVLTRIKPGFTKEQSARLAAAQFGRTEQEMLRLLERPGTVVKKEVDEETALQYRRALERVGCLSSKRMVGFGRAVFTETPLLRYGELAELGDAEAQYLIACDCCEAEGVVPDIAQALVWFRKAAAQGHAEAQYRLGAWLTEDPIDVPEADAVEAIGWLRKAAEQGHAKAAELHACMYMLGRCPRRDPEGEAWLRQAGRRGDLLAQRALAKMYEAGHGVAIDERKAVDWYREAAMQGHAGSQCLLGLRYLAGEGVPRDVGMGERWLRKAADQGDETARRICAEHGSGN